MATFYAISVKRMEIPMPSYFVLKTIYICEISMFSLTFATKEVFFNTQ